MEEAFYQGESPEENTVQANGLTQVEMEQIAHLVHSKAEYLDHRFDWIEYAEKYWKFMRWSIENTGAFDEFDLGSDENV